MLNITKTHTSVEKNANETINYTTYEVDGNVKLAMDSIWDYNGSDTVAVKSIQVIESKSNDEDYTYTQVNVEHDATWNIYTDSGFENAISKTLNMDVSFTEQGMQDDELASMEV